MRMIIVLLVPLAAATGCTGAGSQLATCQAEKEQLLATIRGQRETTRSLEQQVASLENRLDQSEKELARRPTDIRVSSRPAEPVSAPVAPLAPPTKATQRPSDSLPWRAPTSTGEQKQPGAEKPHTSSKQPTAGAATLLALARKDQRVRYDADSQAAKIELPVAFSELSATLTGEDKKQLDEVARLLKSAEARDLRIMVAGRSAGRLPTADAKADGERFASARQLGTARAQAVADYLDRHGIAQERLAVSATGVPAASGAAVSPVEIYLLDRDAPVVGWEPGKAVRR